MGGRSRKNSLWQRRWRRFKQNRRGYWSLLLFSLLFALSLGAELLSNDKPFLVSYNGELYAPMVRSYPETTFGGDFETEADYRDPYLLGKITTSGNWVLFAPNPHSFASINTQLNVPVPSPPSPV
ncbi:MAG: ABC transporter permease, partial [Desulfobulbaceae bacterium]|nr:ABC transporter permease [Desulfobulbaceae bacterium]